MIRANFKLSKETQTTSEEIIVAPKVDKSKNLSKEEFEEFVVKSGAAGSFMVFRSNKKNEEMGLDEL